MSDPAAHFVAGAVVGGFVGTKTLQGFGYRPKPITIATVSGLISVALDLDHLPRFIQAGWKYSEVISVDNDYVIGRLYHREAITLVAVIAVVLTIFWLSVKAIKSSNITTGFCITLCMINTLGILWSIHMIMDYIFQCMIYPVIRCGWMFG